MQKTATQHAPPRRVLSQIPSHQQPPINPHQSQSSNVQQLINKIQHTIVQVSDMIKNQLQNIEYNELVSYKDDLFKTQQQFIKIRAEKNQDVIKNKIMQQKNQVQGRFQVQMKKSMEMTKKYDQLKHMFKKMNQQERQLKLEIKYMKNKLATTKMQGENLDEQYKELKKKYNPTQRNSITVNSNNKNSAINTVSNRNEQQKKLFTQIVNKCDAKLNQKEQTTKLKNQLVQFNNQTTNKSKNSTKYGSDFCQKLDKKKQKFLKQQIQNLKDYVQNIPLQLNFIQNKMYKLLYPQNSRQDEYQQQLGSDEIKQEQTQQRLQIKQNMKQFQTHKTKPDYSNLNSSIQKLPPIKNSYKFEQLLKDNQVKKYIYEMLFD